MATAVLLLLSLIVTGTYADLRSEIEDANARFTEAFNRQDAEAVSQFYTEDCSMMPAGSDVVQGKADVKKVINSFFQTDVGSVVIKIDEVGPSDATDTLYERSHYTFFDMKGNIIDKGKHVVVWKKVTGEWRLHIDIFNSNINPAQKSGEDALKEEIVALNKQYTEEWVEQDAEGVASFYTCDAKSMGPGMDVIHGKEAITDFLKVLFGMGVARIDLDTKDISTMGASEDTLYEKGYYTLSDAKGGVFDYGKYIYLWKRVDGQWKIYVDIFNTNSSPPESHDEL